MTLITKPRTDKRPPASDPEPTTVAPPPKLRRRPVGVVVSAATIVLGSVLGLMVWSAAGSTTEVLAVRSQVFRGEVIDRDDLVVVRVGLDPAVQAVPASQLDTIAGKRAALDLAAGGLLAPADVATTVLPGKGTSVVGIALAPGLLPAEPLAPGDAVRLVQTPGQQGEVTGTPPTVPAQVVGVHPSETSDKTVVDVLVPAEAAAELASRAATGKVALVLDSRER